MTVEMAPRRTEYIPLDHLTPDSSNPKAHDLEIIDASVGRFGMIDQIVRDDRTGKIISGHGRHMALVSMRNRGETPPEGVRVDASGHWLVPVVVGWASRTDAEARAALVALNQTTILGGWVDDSLLDLLDGLVADGEHGLDGVGFDEDSIDALRERLIESSAGEPEVLLAGQSRVSAVPEFDGGKVDLGEGVHTCPRCRFTFDD